MYKKQEVGEKNVKLICLERGVKKISEPVSCILLGSAIVKESGLGKEKARGLLNFKGKLNYIEM